jgi:hypothetical protein
LGQLICTLSILNTIPIIPFLLLPIPPIAACLDDHFALLIREITGFNVQQKLIFDRQVAAFRDTHPLNT